MREREGDVWLLLRMEGECENALREVKLLERKCGLDEQSLPVKAVVVQRYPTSCAT